MGSSADFQKDSISYYVTNDAPENILHTHNKK